MTSWYDSLTRGARHRKKFLMHLPPDNPTVQQAAYMILTAAYLHPGVGINGAGSLILAARRRVVSEMAEDTYLNARILVSMLVYPRFDSGRDCGW